LLLWLKLPLLVLQAIAQCCCGGQCSCPEGGVYTMRYLEGALPNPPLPEDAGMILFLFFSSATAMAYIVLSWSMAALTKSL
jgi:hypothetical protein